MTERATPDASEGPIGADHVERVASRVPGWLSPMEGRLLYDLARVAPADGCIVEIGSWQGRSTIWLAAGARCGRGVRVVAVDPHRDSRLHTDGGSTELALRSNLASAGFSDQVDVVVGTSRDASEGWTRPISLLWIDGDHEYESVKEDFLLWEKHVVDGGVVALHDTLYWDGPARVVSEFLQRLRRYSDLHFVDSITYATRRRNPTLRQVLRKRKAVAHRHVYRIRAGAAADPFHLADALDGLERLRRIAVPLRRRRDDR